MAATQGDTLANVQYPDIRRKKIVVGQQKREALEREVALLQKMLKQEEVVHKILQRVHNGNDGSAISIPNFLPPKAKELLAELAMVEGEIARLEGQISQLQQGLKREQEATNEMKSRQWKSQPGVRSNRHVQFAIPDHIPTHFNKDVQEKTAFETKALHFISKAIKGDYNLSDFIIQDKIGSARTLLSDQKENHFHEQSKLQDRVPRKSGVLLKSPSPMREFRYPTPKPKERNVEIAPAVEPLPKALSNSIMSEDSVHQWQPNKLSENIIKCLNFIYIRLLRTSRAVELEKSGPISRSLHSSLSFRAETGPNSKSSLLSLKESRQQDPYGIFNLEESIPRDIGPYKNLVIFTSSSMDPKCISSSSSIPLLRKLRGLMNNLQTVDLRLLTHQQKLAFWINMYNACIMHRSHSQILACTQFAHSLQQQQQQHLSIAASLMHEQAGGYLQYGVPSNPEKLLTLMNKATLNIGGNSINAQAIEHCILRKPSPSSKVNQKNEKDDKEATVRKLYGLETMDPNITFALCCGTRSCPAVRVYTGEGVVAELEKSKLEYLQASIIVTSTKRIAIPELLLQNMLDFAMDTDSLVEWVCHQLPTSGSLRKSIVDCFRGHNTSGKIPTVAVEKIPYDFEFQYLLAI